MSRLTSVSDASLCEATVRLVSEERRITLELIAHLREIDRRLLFADLGYGSLFDFCTRHLGLSEGSAQRRISAMRLARDVPEAKTALSEGKLSLSNAAKLQSAFRAQKNVTGTMSLEQKTAVVTQVSGLSQRECENKLFEILPLAMAEQNRERERLVGVDTTEVRLIIDPSLGAKLTRLKELHSHSVPDGSLLKLLELLADRELARLDKKLSDSSDKTPIPVSGASDTPSASNTSTAVSTTAAAVRNEREPSGTSVRAAIPAAARRIVWKNARGTCEFPGCGSRYQLQIDHRVPIAQGGTNAANNLRLLCQTHNLQQAKAWFGENRMRTHVPRMR